MNLDQSFEDDLRQAVLDDVEQKARDEIGPRLKQVAQENWQAYAQKWHYDIDHIWEDAEGPFVDRDGESVSIRIEWPGLTALFEFGVSPHTIDGSPLLHFYWEGHPGGAQWVQTGSVNWGSVTGGIMESRAIRDAVDQMEGEM